MLTAATPRRRGYPVICIDYITLKWFLNINIRRAQATLKRLLRGPTTIGVVVAHHHQSFVIRTAVVVLVQHAVVLVVPFR